MFASHSTQPVAGTSPWTAANAMTMPKLKAMPRKAWGMEKKRLVNGYRMVNSTAGTDQATASQRVVSTRPRDTSASTTPTATASLTETWPEVMGRCVVRLTCLSKSRSAMSLMQQPALRISTVPSTNTSSRCQPGKPSAATHSAASVGQTSTSQPAGRFQRMRSR
ncbi:hypothetical protein D3C78_1293870 [compost metagenome]